MVEYCICKLYKFN